MTAAPDSPDDIAAEVVTRYLAARPATPTTDTERKYAELIYAVESKHPAESRHETALRYIRQAEEPHGPARAASTSEGR